MLSHWLRTLMQFVLPPARVLEVGCGHGGFVAMMRQAGYDAMGLELSPSIVKFARDTFDIPVIRDHSLGGQLQTLDHRLANAFRHRYYGSHIAEHPPV